MSRPLRFELSLARKTWQLNEIHVLQVMVDVDCRLPSGDAVVGKLSATSCW